jgi:LPS sulfotransferase NodH
MDDLVNNRRTLIIATVPRTGSTMLSGLLESTRLAGNPAEYLGAKAILGRGPDLGIRTRRLASIPKLERYRLGFARQGGMLSHVAPSKVRGYLDAVEDAHRGPNGVFALKIHRNQFEFATERCGVEFPVPGPDVVWVYLRREDRFAQAVSYLRAMQTQRWHTKEAADGKPVYDPGKLRGCVGLFISQTKAWERLFATFENGPLRVTYEDLIRDPNVTVYKILGLLGEVSTTVPETTLQVQRDSLTDEWIERMLVDLPELVDQRYARSDIR